MRSQFDLAVSDFDAAFERLRVAFGDEDEQRRAWLEAINHTYRLREHRKPGCGRAKEEFESHARESSGGKVTEGVVVVRNIATHILAQSGNPRAKGLYPSEKQFPSPYLYPGHGNMFWLDIHEFDQDAAKAVKERDGCKCYEHNVAGFLVLDTLVAARHFLVEYPTRSPN